VARINAVDPTFLTRFGADFQSGDHLRIQRAIEEGGRLFLDAASVEGALPGHVVPEAKCIAVFVVAILVFFVFAVTGGETEDGLHRAQIVDTIATRFAN
jgi:SdpC family antimicrobial peptide